MGRTGTAWSRAGLLLYLRNARKKGHRRIRRGTLHRRVQRHPESLAQHCVLMLLLWRRHSGVEAPLVPVEPLAKAKRPIWNLRRSSNGRPCSSSGLCQGSCSCVAARISTAGAVMARVSFLISSLGKVVSKCWSQHTHALPQFC